MTATYDDIPRGMAREITDNDLVTLGSQNGSILGSVQSLSDRPTLRPIKWNSKDPIAQLKGSQEQLFNPLNHHPRRGAQSPYNTAERVTRPAPLVFGGSFQRSQSQDAEGYEIPVRSPAPMRDVQLPHPVPTRTRNQSFDRRSSAASNSFGR